MNKKKVVKTIAQRTGILEETCFDILESYEKYCEDNLRRASEKYKLFIADVIAEETLIDIETCQKVMDEFFDLLEGELKNKIPFIK